MISLRPEVKVETFFFVPNLNVEEAKVLLYGFINMCIALLPHAERMEAPFVGIKDPTIRDDVLYSRTLWLDTNVGTLRKHDAVVVVHLLHGPWVPSRGT